MADARALRHQHAHRGLRAGAAAGLGGDHDARALSLTSVVVYHAAGCHLCERALEVVEAVRLEHPFDLELVDVGGDPELEARYRERIPVVEIDGRPAFTFFVTPDALAAQVR